jgi:UDP-galactopyranose mutase
MKNITRFPEHIVCFSHLRWDFVYQRPQHLLSRFANDSTIHFFEEPVYDAEGEPYLTFSRRESDIWITVPHLPVNLSKAEEKSILTSLLGSILVEERMQRVAFWYYTPMALEFSDNFEPGLIVYDCMDELSAFKFAPRSIRTLEKRLMAKSDVVFTGGQSLYEAKKDQHANIYPFPSSIDKQHFIKARKNLCQPSDQKDIKGPKIGFYGVIDERFDIELVAAIADSRPDWQIVLIGPVVKIDPAALPEKSNIHYLGPKSYEELPGYLSGWNVALIPFMINESTRFISPTKTPEYLASGIPVVSTAIRDVVNPYGLGRVVHIGFNAIDFIKAIDLELLRTDKTAWLSKVDTFLAGNSWNATYISMHKICKDAILNKSKVSIAS